MILWVDQTRDHSWDKIHSQGMWFYQRPWCIPSRMEMQVFPLYPTNLSLEKATWSLGHSCPCDIMAISSSTILPASAKTSGAATREGYEHLNHCPKTMGSKCCVRLRHSLPQEWGVAPWPREALDDFKDPGKEQGAGALGTLHRDWSSLMLSSYVLIAEA